MTAETWVDVPGYEGTHQANYNGNIRRIYSKSGKKKILTPYHKKMKGSQRLVVKMTANGHSKEVVVMSIIARTFLGICPAGYMPIHKNGLQEDNCAGNIMYISREEAGKLTGAASRRKPVAKIDCNGEVIAFYKSAREAARYNFMSYQTIIDRCNGKVKGIYAPDGYVYVWDEDKSIKKAQKEIAKQ